MKAEIISIGTELLLGHTVNTDMAIIARKLAELGVDLERAQTVGDNAARLETAFKEALARADIVIASGGLGPTEDDLTKETAARVVNLPMAPHPESERLLRRYFGSRPIGANQFKQTLAPAGAEVFKNDVGTAPGYAIPAGEGKFIILLPGPPRELAPMLENEVAPFLSARTNGLIVSKMIRVFGMGEGAAAAKLGKLLESANPTAATYAGDGEVMVKLTAKGENAEGAETLLAPLLDKVREILGNVVYGVDVPSLEAVVVKELAERKLKIAAAESCTGGLLAKRITDVPGSSEVFEYGVVTYANRAKERALAIPAQILNSVGAVSPEVAKLMADNVREFAESDIGVGITGIAGPGGGTASKPLGLVYVAISATNGAIVRKIEPKGKYLGREWTRRHAASVALDMTRRLLLNMPQDAAG